MESPKGAVTELLVAWQAGDETAKDQLFVLLYEDLYRMARQQRDQWRGDNTLNTTALLHELFLKLSRQGVVRAEDRGQFNRFVAKALRHILMDYAKTRGRQRRGGGVVKVPLNAFYENAVVALDAQQEVLFMMDEALAKLAVLNTRLSDVVELRFYAGLTYDEIALSLGITKRTVTRDWAKAKVWLHRILRELDDQPDQAG